jgi:hypothetical protein
MRKCFTILYEKFIPAISLHFIGIEMTQCTYISLSCSKCHIEYFAVVLYGYKENEPGLVQTEYECLSLQWAGYHSIGASGASPRN